MSFWHSTQTNFALALVLRPFLSLLIVVFLASPVERLVRRKMRNGKLKRLLLHRFGEKSSGDAGGVQEPTSSPHPTKFLGN
jgi:hypothetical protein